MSKIVLDNVESGFNLQKINSNFQKLEDELNNKVLYRVNPAGEPNSLENAIDFNNQDLLNVKDITLQGTTLSLEVAKAETAATNAINAANVATIEANEAFTFASTAGVSAANAGSSETAAGTSATTASTKASEAAASAVTAAASASGAVVSAASAATSASSASTSATNAAASASAAAASEAGVAASASAAATSATNAATSATNAASSATAAASSATAASGSATAAAGSATSAATSAANAGAAEINYVIDGVGNVLFAGSKGTLEIPFNCTINSWTLIADVSGSVIVDVKKAAYADFPTTVSITASAIPTLSSTQKAQSSTLTGWTTSVSAGDILEFVVNGTPATITRAVLSLKVTRV
jgi:hypothetical protein